MESAGAGGANGVGARLMKGGRSGAALAAAFDEEGQAKGNGCAGGKVAMDGLEIAPQQVREGGFADGAGLQIEQEGELPLREGVPPEGAVDDFLDELTERRQVRASRLCICQVRECSFPQKILCDFCDSSR